MKSLFTLAILFYSSIIFCQDQVWNISDLGRNVNLVQTDDGAVLVSDASSLRSISPTNGEVLWSVTDVKDIDELVLMNDYPYLQNTGKNYSIIDSRDGSVISHHPERTSIESMVELYEQNALLFNLKSGKADVIELLDLKTNKLWSTKIADKVSSGGLLSTYTSPVPVVNTTGQMVVFRKKEFYIIDGESGKVINSIDLDKNYDILSISPDQSTFLIQWDKKMLRAYSTESGKLLWEVKNRKRNLQVLPAGDDQWAVINDEDYVIYSMTLGEIIKEDEWKDEPEFLQVIDNKLYAGIKKQICELDPTDLTILRSKTFDDDVKSLEQVGTTFFLNTKKYNNEIELQDFELRYPYKNKLPREIENMVIAGDNTIYIYGFGVQKELILIDRNGAEVWGYKTTSLEAPSVDIVNNDKVLLISDSKIAMLNLSDGKSFWKKSISIKPGFAYALNDKSQKLGIYNDKRGGYIDLKSAEIVMFEEKVKFKDFDSNVMSPTIAMLSEGLYLKGSNSIAFYDMDGNLKYNHHYKKSDNDSGLLKVANFAVTAGAIASGNAGSVITVSNANTGEVLHKGGMVDDLENSYAYSNQMKTKRQRLANRGSLAIPYVFTKLENGDRGLVFFDIVSGDEIYEIATKEKQPLYIMDDYEGFLYYYDTKANEIRAYKLR